MAPAGGCRHIGGGERTGAVVARGEAEIAFQQMSEVLPVPGIAHITPLPAEVQKVSVFSAGIATTSPDAELARSGITFLASAEARNVIPDRASSASGLVVAMPAENTETFCTSAGSGVMCAIPGTGSTSLICWNAISASPRATTAPVRSPPPMWRHPPAGATPPPSGAAIQPLRRNRLGGLIHEYVQVA